MRVWRNGRRSGLSGESSSLSTRTNFLYRITVCDILLQQLVDRIIYAIPFLAKLQDWVIALGEHKSATRWLYGLADLLSFQFLLTHYWLELLWQDRGTISASTVTGLASTLGGIAGWGLGFGLAMLS